MKELGRHSSEAITAVSNKLGELADVNESVHNGLLNLINAADKKLDEHIKKADAFTSFVGGLYQQQQAQLAELQKPVSAQAQEMADLKARLEANAQTVHAALAQSSADQAQMQAQVQEMQAQVQKMLQPTAEWQGVFTDVATKIASIESVLDAKFHEVDAALEELRNRPSGPTMGGTGSVKTLVDEPQARDIVRFDKGDDAAFQLWAEDIRDLCSRRKEALDGLSWAVKHGQKDIPIETVPEAYKSFASELWSLLGSKTTGTARLLRQGLVEGHGLEFWRKLCSTPDLTVNLEALHRREHCLSVACGRMQNSTELKVSINGPPAQLDLHIEETGMMSRNSGFNICLAFENERRSMSVHRSVSAPTDMM